MIYTHVLNRGPGAVRSPADTLLAETVDRAPADDQPILMHAPVEFHAPKDRW